MYATDVGISTLTEDKKLNNKREKQREMLKGDNERKEDCAEHETNRYVFRTLLPTPRVSREGMGVVGGRGERETGCGGRRGRWVLFPLQLDKSNARARAHGP